MAEQKSVYADRKVVEINAAVLGKNDALANENRTKFQSLGMLVLNVLSSPGSGKTTLLEKTIEHYHGSKTGIGVIVGDLATERDADRLKNAGPAPVVPITTGRTCHLDASMVRGALEKMDLAKVRLLFIENVGNLVCPASYDLGEASRVVILSVTEGEDKPLKYPVIFRAADLVIITKVDLAEPCDFNRTDARDNIHKVAPGAAIIELSAKTGHGMDQWFGYLEHRLA